MFRKHFEKIIAVILIIATMASSNSYVFSSMNNENIGANNKRAFILCSEAEKKQQDNLEEELFEELIEIDTETLDNIDTEVSGFGLENEHYGSNLNEIYGSDITSITSLSFQDIAKTILSAYLNLEISDYNNIDCINLSKSILLKDANDNNTYIAFNYTTSDNQYGYITIATHTKTVLIRDIVENQSLPKNVTEMYYLSNGEFYYYLDNYYHTLDGTKITMKEFHEFLGNRKTNYYNFTLEMLAEIEADTISQLNNLIVIDYCDLKEEYVGKSYKGQEGSGYGGITNCKSYLKDRYGGTVSLSSSKSLSMANFKQGDLEKDANNCTLAAITRILYYYYKNGYTKINSNYNKIYKKVKSIATKYYGYTSKKGTFPTKINNIVEHVLDDYGYGKSKCNGIYIWSFNNEVKKQIDNNKPVIMNIVRGFYGSHSVTVCGYAKYNVKKTTLFFTTNTNYNMVRLYDGWRNYVRYLDYKAFAYDLISAGFGSFNTITMKK